MTKEELNIALGEYRVTKIVRGREVPKRKIEPKSMPLISFPWLFHKELSCITTGIDTSVALDELKLSYWDTRRIVYHGDVIEEGTLVKKTLLSKRIVLSSTEAKNSTCFPSQILEPGMDNLKRQVATPRVRKHKDLAPNYSQGRYLLTKKHACVSKKHGG